MLHNLLYVYATFDSRFDIIYTGEYKRWWTIGFPLPYFRTNPLRTVTVQFWRPKSWLLFIQPQNLSQWSCENTQLAKNSRESMRILGLIAFTFQGKLRDLLSISSNHLGIALGDWHPGHIPHLPSAENQAIGSKSWHQKNWTLRCCLPNFPC